MVYSNHYLYVRTPVVWTPLTEWSKIVESMQPKLLWCFLTVKRSQCFLIRCLSTWCSCSLTPKVATALSSLSLTVKEVTALAVVHWLSKWLHLLRSFADSQNGFISCSSRSLTVKVDAALLVSHWLSKSVQLMLSFPGSQSDFFSCSRSLTVKVDAALCSRSLTVKVVTAPAVIHWQNCLDR